MSDAYQRFVASNLGRAVQTGMDGFSLPSAMFPHQSALTAWALRRGRAAIFADTGLQDLFADVANA
jgi:hypothetical protein